MPALAFTLLGFAGGAALAWVASDELTRQGSVIGRPLSIVTLLSFLVYAPATAYLVTFFPDWSFAYFVDVIPAWPALPAATSLVTAMAAPLGFIAATRWSETRKPSRALRLALVPAALALASLVTLAPRLRVYANYAQFHGDFGTQPIAGSPLGYAILWSSLITALGLLWTARALKERGHPSDTQGRD